MSGRGGDGCTRSLVLLDDLGHRLCERRVRRFKTRNCLVQLCSLGSPRGGGFNSFAARHENMLSPMALDVQHFDSRR